MSAWNEVVDTAYGSIQGLRRLKHPDGSDTGSTSGQAGSIVFEINATQRKDWDGGPFADPREQAEA